jgi:hypothetical protein
VSGDSDRGSGICKSQTKGSRALVKSVPLLVRVSVLFLSCLAVALTLLPGSVWHHPSTDFALSGFDTNLLYVTTEGKFARSHVDRGSVILAGGPASTVVVNLVTTPLTRLDMSLTVTIVGSKPTPFRLGVWSPWSRAGYFLVFGEDPDRTIRTELIEGGLNGPILHDGQVVRTRVLGQYGLGSPYTLSLDVVKGNRLSFSVGDAKSHLAADSIPFPELPALLTSSKLSVTGAIQGGLVGDRVELTGYRLALPHDVAWANKTDDWVPRAGILLVVAGAGLLVGGMLISSGIASRLRPRKLKAGFVAVARAVPTHLRSRRIALAFMVIALYIIGNALLFRLGSHPFDMANEKSYAYIADSYGPASLYYLSNVTSFPAIWHGVPFSEAAFPYEPVIAYLFGAIGWLYSHIFFGGPSLNGGVGLEYVIKAVNVGFGLADSALIYIILRSLGVSRAWRLAGSLLFMFNPAVWFSMSVWGQTHVISVFFALLAIWAVQKNQPFWAWLALAATCLTRPQMLAFGVVFGVLMLRRFPIRSSLYSAASAGIAVFVGIAPVSFATSPSLPLDIAANNFRIQEAGGNDPLLTTVSQDAYSIWPLVTYLKQGSSGLLRSFSPSSQPLWGSLTYQRAGLVATVIVLIAISLVILRRPRREIEIGAYIPLLALAMMAFLIFMTGLVATHFILALPLLILCRRWMGTGAYLFVVIVWTVTTLVPMYGDMGNVIRFLNYPLLSPDHNVVTSFFVALYSWDRFITFATLANVCAMVWLGFTALRPPTQPRLRQSAV